MKTRYFPYDVFLSHNQDDGSHVIRDELTRLGARVWHDGYADITDRLVVARVRGGIVKSRYVCVCIGQDFRDSDWVRMEYSAGLQSNRALVIATDASPAIPKALTDQRIFPVYAEGFDPLARFLISQNTRGDSGLAGEEETRRVNIALGLRSHLQGQTRLKPSLIEKARLLKERCFYLLAHPEKGDIAALFGDLRYLLKDTEHRRFLAGFFADDEHELRAIALDMFEALSRQPDQVRELISSPAGSSDHVLDPLIDLLRHPTEAQRALRVLDAICAALQPVWQANKFTRKYRAAYRWHAEQIRKGKPFEVTRQVREKRKT